MSQMQRVALGNTGLEVSRLALGGLFVSSIGGEFEQSQAAVLRALELGVNTIDTAPGYANSEEVLGRVLADVDQPVILSTKLGGRPQPFEPQDRDCLMRSVEESLRVLGRDTIDILMVHEPDRPGQYDWWTDFQTVTGPVLDLLGDLKQQGVIRFSGIGGTTVSELAHLCRSGKFDVVLTAFNYSPLYQEAGAEVIPAAREQGMGVIVGSPLQQGAFARRYEAVYDPTVYWLSKARREQFKALYSLVEECGLTLPELALRFVVSNPDVHCVLMGARSVTEVEQNAAAVNDGPLPEELLTRLNEIAAMVPFRPAAEPFGIGWHLANPTRYKGPGHG